jgi:hypothetical protein
MSLHGNIAGGLGSPYAGLTLLTNILGDTPVELTDDTPTRIAEYEVTLPASRTIEFKAKVRIQDASGNYSTIDTRVPISFDDGLTGTLQTQKHDANLAGAHAGVSVAWGVINYYVYLEVTGLAATELTVKTRLFIAESDTNVV